MARTRERPKKPYLGAAELDRLARMNTELLSELWILRDRVTVLEHLLEKQKLLQRKELDELIPEGALAAELERERTRMVARVMGAATDVVPDLETLKAEAIG
jgi:hypothetical protein